MQHLNLPNSRDPKEENISTLEAKISALQAKLETGEMLYKKTVERQQNALYRLFFDNPIIDILEKLQDALDQIRSDLKSLQDSKKEYQKKLAVLITRSQKDRPTTSQYSELHYLAISRSALLRHAQETPVSELRNELEESEKVISTVLGSSTF